MAKWNKINYAPDAGGASGSTTTPQVVVDDGAEDFTPQFGEGIAVVNDPSAGPSREELEKLFQTQKDELEALKAKSGETSSQNAQFAQLAEALKGVASRPITVTTPQVQAPGESFDAYKERIEKQFIEKPLESITEVVQKTAAPAVEALAAQTAKLAKRTAMLDSGDQEFWKKHADEIDALSASFSPQDRLDPEAYSRAYDIVRGRHVDELLASMKAKEGITTTPTAPTSGAAATPTSPAASPTASSPLAGAAADDGKVHITRSDALMVQDYMMKQCIPEGQFERTVLYLRSIGALRKY